MTTAGVDEVGKGSLFGPVFAAAVVLSKSSGEELLKLGLKDSKLISHKKRAFLVPIIKEISESWGLGQSSANEIDKLGIRSATEKAMLRSLQRLDTSVDLVLVDGILPIRSWEGIQKTVVKGETKHACIAAASVIAKEARDQLIKRLSIQFSGYSLEKNFGYGTSEHRKAIIKNGPSKLHRYSFLSKIIT